ncbi:MAG TPA: hypothetical protein VN634_01685 [Candidatus Limnocylindrales bacterium]|nr:hypothetical protein [Candidatus Limnocylindrales bacterium]
MKVRRASINLRKKQLELVTRSGRLYPMPFARMMPRPSVKDPVVELHLDSELGNEAVTYTLASGEEGSVHIDHALDYNSDPTYLAELALHRLTCDVASHVKSSGLSIREIARRLRTSVTQVYRLLDTTNYSKSFVQTHALLQIVDCELKVEVKPRRASRASSAKARSRKAA